MTSVFDEFRKDLQEKGGDFRRYSDIEGAMVVGVFRKTRISQAGRQIAVLTNAEIKHNNGQVESPPNPIELSVTTLWMAKDEDGKMIDGELAYSFGNKIGVYVGKTVESKSGNEYRKLDFMDFGPAIDADEIKKVQDQGEEKDSGEDLL